MKLRILDLFSGIGGISLGLERTGGFETVAFCEIDKAAQKVLKKHWPDVPIFEDVTTISTKDIDGAIDVMCGGFPCQDLSVAGRGAGLEGARSGLWWEFHRLIKEAQPKWVLIENVSVLRSRGLDQVLRSLFEIGYDAEWHCIPASAVGAPHRRDRIWIVAYPRHGGGGNVWASEEGDNPQSQRATNTDPLGGSGEQSSSVADTSGSGLQGPKLLGIDPTQLGCGEEWEFGPTPECGSLPYWGGWGTEPSVGRVANGIPGRVDRLKQLGNSVVPQIPELIGRAILQRS